MTLNKSLSAGNQNIEIDMNQLSSGIYFATIISSSVVETVRLVKE